MHVPLDFSISTLIEIPYTIAFVIRKRMQVDSLLELPKDKRPSEEMIWDGTPEELESFLDRIFKGKENSQVVLEISDSEIER